jgi:hypothetical protein
VYSIGKTIETLFKRGGQTLRARYRGYDMEERTAWMDAMSFVLLAK